MSTTRRADEAYVLALCDEVVGSPGVREARFDWLRGNPGRNGRRRHLPVDAYWPDSGLVVEFYEYQYDQARPFFDKTERRRSAASRAASNVRSTTGIASS